MTYLRSRIKPGAWIAFAGLLSTVLVLVIENISRFNLSDTWQAIVVIALTAIVSQITKYLNVDRKRVN